MQKLRMPFKKSTMVCGYKTQRYLKAWGYPHYGVDISTYQGTEADDHTVYASGTCKVVAAGVGITLAGEFVTGCIVNLWLGWAIWDYSDLPGNILGQVCPQFALLWIPLVLLAIVLDDVIRWQFYGEECPRYYIFGRRIRL